MEHKIFFYHILIKENHLDTFGHVNNATYLSLLEEARWDLLTNNGYGLKKIQHTGIGPTILEINIKYLRELKLREEIIIETQMLSYTKKIGTLRHIIKRQNEVCCTADFTIAIFDLKERKIITANEEWLKALGIEG